MADAMVDHLKVPRAIELFSHFSLYIRGVYLSKRMARPEV